MEHGPDRRTRQTTRTTHRGPVPLLRRAWPLRHTVLLLPAKSRAPPTSTRTAPRKPSQPHSPATTLNLTRKPGGPRLAYTSPAIAVPIASGLPICNARGSCFFGSEANICFLFCHRPVHQTRKKTRRHLAAALLPQVVRPAGRSPFLAVVGRWGHRRDAIWVRPRSKRNVAGHIGRQKPRLAAAAGACAVFK